jgi:carbamoyltransferase
MGKLHMGINMGHDRSVAVVEDGEVRLAIEQERLDRIKHSVGFMYQSPGDVRHIQVPGECIRYCLDTLGVALSEIATITANMPGIDHAPDILRAKFSREIAGQVRVVPSHHLAHAYSAYWPSGFEDALILVVDASGRTYADPQGWETESYSLYTGRGGVVELLHGERVRAHLAQLSTLGFVYEYIARKAGFVTRVNEGLSYPEAGKLMGLAAYGGPQPHWERWLVPEPGSPRVAISAYDIFLEVAALEKRYDDGEGKPYFRPWLVDLAYKVQSELEHALCHIVDAAVAETGLRKLCLAGGVSLNSVANHQMLRRCGLEDMFIFPAAADNGIAAGCALWAYHHLEGGTLRPKLTSATLGRCYSEAEVDAALERYRDLVVVERHDHQGMVDCVASALAAGHIVGRFEGGCEYGPRALGHRSILADPAFPRMKDVLNARVKFREAFRPFAPVVPRERADEFFDIGLESPFMLLVAPVRPAFHDILPGVTHQDGTGRVQTCTSEDNPFFDDLCRRVESLRGGPPVLLNTSFNIAGQPIVETPEEAIRTFLRTDIDYLALEDRWIRRKHEPVKSYDSHVDGLPVEAMPHGLGSAQPSVRPLMDELDAALFGSGESVEWTGPEIRALSEQGACWKETSRLYAETGFTAPLNTQVAPDTVLVVNPRGESAVVDQTGRQPPLRLRRDEVEVLLALRVDPADVRDRLRVELGMTPFELHEEIHRLATLLARFGMAVDPAWLEWGAPEDTPLEPSASAAALEAFADPGFRSWRSLETFHRRLVELGYSEARIVDLLGVESLQQIEPTHLHYYCAHKLPQTPLADLVRLFLLQGGLSRERTDELLGAATVARLVGLGILRNTDAGVEAAVDLFCSGGMLFATDHRYMLMDADALDEDSVMYIGMDSHGLVQTAPRNACGRLLDLCCGSGVQGLVGCRYSVEVVAVDLNPRGVRFARFNAQLNGVSGYEVREGNLYEAVGDETFDVILANPPFVPSPETSLKFRDGGADGEAILRLVVEGAAARLNPGGRLCVVTDLVDVGSYSAKLRRWWGSDEMEGLVLTTADRDEILFSVPHCHAPFGQGVREYNAELSKWVQSFRRAGLQAVNFGYILVWAGRAGDGDPITLRTIHNPSTPIHEEVAAWYEQRCLWARREAEDYYLRLHPDLRMRVEHSPGRADCAFELTVRDNPFFTTYLVGETIYNELQRIFEVHSRLRSRLTPVDEGWVEDLHRKGILRLSRDRRRSESEASVHGEKHDLRVDELATRTTPTCLSSYLG